MIMVRVREDLSPRIRREAGAWRESAREKSYVAPLVGADSRLRRNRLDLFQMCF